MDFPHIPQGRHLPSPSQILTQFQIAMEAVLPLEDGFQDAQSPVSPLGGPISFHDDPIFHVLLPLIGKGQDVYGLRYS